MPKVTQKQAFESAAAVIRSMDLEQLFGDHLYSQAFGKDPASIDLLDAVQKDIAERVEHMKLSRNNR